MTEEKKRIITKIDNLTFALWGIKNAIRHIEVCCEACDTCEMRNQECRVAKSYRRLTTMRRLLSEEISELENPR